MEPIPQATVRWRQTVLAAMIALAVAPGCASGPEDLCRQFPVENEETYRQEVEARRAQREQRFRTSPQSPVPDSLSTRWQGLEFYPVRPIFRLEGPLVRRTNGRSFRMATTTGELRPCREVGYFLLDLGRGPETLPVYAFESDGVEEDDLFLPFTDASTEAGETYPAGRYLDVVALDRGRYLLDFNLAYNPYCAYGGAWDCPIAPAENRLKAAVEAGERGWYEEELSFEEEER